MRVAYTTSADLARDLEVAWKSSGRVAYARPYNRWQWEGSHYWWVVPASEQPSFQYGKIV